MEEWCLKKTPKCERKVETKKTKVPQLCFWPLLCLPMLVL